jgi:two-component system cell cycle response regulator DivK
MERPVTGLVVIAEDNALNLRLFADVLRGAGYRVAEAGNGAEALARVNELRPDLLLLDLDLPRMAGDQVARALRGDPRHARLPILLVSAHAREIAERRAAGAGCDGWLQKPVRPDALLAAVVAQIGPAGPRAIE